MFVESVQIKTFQDLSYGEFFAASVRGGKKKFYAFKGYKKEASVVDMIVCIRPIEENLEMGAHLFDASIVGSRPVVSIPNIKIIPKIDLHAFDYPGYSEMVAGNLIISPKASYICLCGNAFGNFFADIVTGEILEAIDFSEAIMFKSWKIMSESNLSVEILESPFKKVSLE